MLEAIQIEDEVKFLDAKNLDLGIDQYEDLQITLPDSSIQTQIKIIRSFPLSNPNQFICLIDKDNNEIGVIQDIKDLKKSDRKIVVEQLEKTYYMPKIKRINSIDGRFGVTQWQIETNFGPSQINLGSRMDVSPMDNNRVLIKDVDGNRYEIVNYNELDPKSHALLELYL